MPLLSNRVAEPVQKTADDDAALVASCTKGDTDAFETLVQKYQKRMFNIAFRMTGSYEDAGEVVQDAFVSAYRGLKNFQGRSKFSTWLTAITVNHSKNRLQQMKARQAREPLSLDDPVRTEDGSIAVDPPSKGPSVLDRLEARDERKKVQECISALEPEFREVIILRDMQDFSYEEIGSLLKVREGTVKSRLFRAREAVKDCLKRAFGTL
ncbi:MAG: sigma-70 family RNA polymerase sigma factor [Nitrospirota bacterium]